MKARLLVLGILLVLVAVTIAACSLGGTAPTQTPVIKEVTKVVEKPVTQVVEKPVTVIVQVTPAPQPTQAPQPTTAPAAKPVAPSVELVIVPVAANAAGDVITVAPGGEGRLAMEISTEQGAVS